VTATSPHDHGSVALDTVQPEIRALLDRVPALAQAEPRIELLNGGLTNQNFKVTTDRGCYVARISSSHSELLAIDRRAERYNSQAAATAGVAPEVIDCIPGTDSAPGVLLIAWVAGRTWQSADLRKPANLPRIAAACRKLHSGPRFANDFDMFTIQRGYLRIVLERGFRLPPRYLEFEPQLEQLRAAVAARPEVSVPCHNDLLAENFIDDSDRLWLIDYEYAGNNDPYFELGNIASESNLSLAQLEELVTHYTGRPDPAKLARARLWGLMSQYGWTLWASIQDGVSDLDFDFWSWGMEKYDRAVATFDSPEFPRLLVEVQQPDRQERIAEGN
jgi:thiamine kinase-like enzyme